MDTILPFTQFDLHLSHKERLSLSLVAALLVGGAVVRDLVVDAKMPMRKVSAPLYPLFRTLIYSAHLWGDEDKDCAGFLAAAIPHLSGANLIGDGAGRFCPEELDSLRRMFLPDDTEDVIHELKTGFRMTGIDFSESDIAHEDYEEGAL